MKNYVLQRQAVEFRERKTTFEKAFNLRSKLNKMNLFETLLIMFEPYWKSTYYKKDSILHDIMKYR